MEDCLQQTLLRMEVETGSLSVNLDHRIALLIRETECMTKMGLPVPNVTMAIFSKRDHFMRISDSLKVRICGPISILFLSATREFQVLFILFYL